VNKLNRRRSKHKALDALFLFEAWYDRTAFSQLVTGYGAPVGQTTKTDSEHVLCGLGSSVSCEHRHFEIPGKARIPVAACLLGLPVRIPPGAWMSVSCECCVLSGRFLAQRSPTECVCVSLSVIKCNNNRLHLH
jgi:hypothetical protein